MFCINNKKNKSAVILSPEAGVKISGASVEFVISDGAKTKRYSAKRDLYGPSLRSTLKMTEKALSFLRLRGASGAQGISTPASCREAHKRHFLFNLIRRSLEKFFQKNFRDDSSFLASPKDSLHRHPERSEGSIMNNIKDWILRFVCTPLRMTIPVLAFLLSLNISTSFAAPTCNCGKDDHEAECCWEIIDDTIYITGTGEMRDYNESHSAPWADNTSFHNVNISGIINVGASAFCSDQFSFGGSIKSVTLADSVKNIGDWSFNDQAIRNLIIPDSVEYIDADAFHDNLLTSVVLPDTTIVGGYSTFGEWFDSPLTVYCKGDLNLCEENLKDIYFDDGYITTVKDSSMCNGNYEWIEESCVRKNNNDKISCASGLVEWNNQCLAEYPFAKKRWTPAEANEWLHDGNDNFVIITFKK